MSVDDLSAEDRMLVYSINPAIIYYDIYVCYTLGKMLIYLPSMDCLPTNFIEEVYDESKLHK